MREYLYSSAAPRGPAPSSPRRVSLTIRVLGYLHCNRGTVRDVARALDAPEKQTDRAVRLLRNAGRIHVLERIESQAKLGLMVNVYGPKED